MAGNYFISFFSNISSRFHSLIFRRLVLILTLLVNLAIAVSLFSFFSPVKASATDTQNGAPIVSTDISLTQSLSDQSLKDAKYVPSIAESKNGLPDDILLATFFESNTLEKTHIQTSLDGISFQTPKNGGVAHVPGTDYDYRMRDTSIAYFDGKFWMTGFGGTTANGDAMIQYGSSTDLINWSPWTIETIKLNIPAPKRADGGVDTVAPEFFVDDDGQAYIIFSSGEYRDKKNVPLGVKEYLWPYAVKIKGNPSTSKLTYQTARKINFNYRPDVDRIDSSILKKDGKYFIFTKPNAVEPIEIHSADTIFGNYQIYNDDIFNSFMYNTKYTESEGPSAVDFRGSVRVYSDNFGLNTQGFSETNRIRFVQSTDLIHWTTRKTIKSSVSQNRHGSVIKITDPHAKQIVWAFRNGIQYLNGDIDGDGIPDTPNVNVKTTNQPKTNQDSDPENPSPEPTNPVPTNPEPTVDVKPTLQVASRPISNFYLGHSTLYEVDIINNSDFLATGVNVNAYIHTGYAATSGAYFPNLVVPAHSKIAKWFSITPTSTDDIKVAAEINAQGTNCPISTKTGCTSPSVPSTVFASQTPSKPGDMLMVLRRNIAAVNCDHGQWQDKGAILTLCIAPPSSDSGYPITSYEITLRSNKGDVVKRTANFDGKPFRFWNLPADRVWSKPEIVAINEKGRSPVGFGQVTFGTSWKYGLGKPFNDMYHNLFTDASGWARKRNITTGIDGLNYAPNSLTNRAQMALFLSRLSGLTDDQCQKKYANFPNPFKDINKKTIGYYAILWSYDHGVTFGTDSSHYSPNRFVTREQMAAFLSRMSHHTESEIQAQFGSISSPFSDVNHSNQFFANIMWLRSSEVTTGTSPTKFSPKMYVNRAQMAAFLYRIAPYVV